MRQLASTEQSSGSWEVADHAVLDMYGRSQPRAEQGTNRMLTSDVNIPEGEEESTEESTADSEEVRLHEEWLDVGYEGGDKDDLDTNSSA